MRPDLSVSFEDHQQGSTKLIILDAKYRVGQQLDDALSSLHMYRDALVQAESDGSRSSLVLAAYILTPDLGTATGDWRSASMPGRLFHPEYRSAFRFGAATMRPGMGMGAIRATIESLIRDAEGEGHSS